MASEGTSVSKMLALAESLIDRTERGLVTWTPSSSGDQFYFSTPSATVSVSSRDSDNRAPYILTLLDAQGRAVESIITQPEVVAASNQVAALFELARQRALNIDKVLDDLLSDIDRQPPPTGPLSIISATYGAGNTWVDVKHYITPLIAEGRWVVINVTNDAFGGDPIYGLPKTLKVTYRVGTDGPRTIEVPEGGQLSIP
jgi:hypothetical protein